MPETFPSIDYEELILSLKEDLDNEYISDTDSVLVVRQKTAVFCESFGKTVNPVLDYFYESPSLNMDIKELTIMDCKKICFEALDKLDENNLTPLKGPVEMIIDELKDYTKGSSKRNERKCKVVFEEAHNVPIMVYFDDNDAGDRIEKIGVKNLISELQECQ